MSTDTLQSPTRLALASFVNLGYSALLIALYMLLDWASFIHPMTVYGITPWNPAPGLALAIIVFAGLRLVPALLLAAFATEVFLHGQTPTEFGAIAPALAISIVYGALAAAFRGPLAPAWRLDSLRAGTQFVGAVAVAAVVVAGVYVQTHVSAGFLDPARFWDAIGRYWIGDLIGILVVVPLLIVHTRAHVSADRAMRRSRVEVALQVLTIGIALLLVFAATSRPLRVAHILFLPMIWIALQHGLRGATKGNLAIQVGVVIGGAWAGIPSGLAFELQILMVALALTSLTLGIVASDRARSALAQRAREDELRQIVGTLPYAMLLLGPRDEVRSANSAAARLFGLPAQALEGRALGELVPAPQPLGASGERRELEAVREDGTRVPVEVSTGVAGAGADAVRVTLLRDLTERRELQARLARKRRDLDRSLRLASVSEMASGLAHELNQPLSAAGNYVRAAALMLKTSERYDARVDDAVSKATAEMARAAGIVRRLRDFFRSGTGSIQRLSVARLFGDNVSLVRERLLDYRIAIEEIAPADLPDVYVDPLQVGVVLQNLINNAIDALREGCPEDRRIVLEARRAGADWVSIQVSDNGPGLAAGLLETLFEPFHSTKHDGMGLGLALSRSIVESNGGSIQYQRAGGGERAGAVFIFTLPVWTA